MYKSEIATAQQIDEALPIAMQIGLVEKWVAAADQVRAIKQRVSRTEAIKLFEEEPAADIAAVDAVARIRQARPFNPRIMTVDAKCPHDAYRRMGFGQCYHLFQTTREQPIVREHYLAVFLVGEVCRSA